MIYTKEEIKNKFQQLEEPLKEAVTSLENMKAVLDQGKKYSLSDEIAKEIYNEVTWVLLGFKKIDDFKNNIKILADNNEETAAKITDEIKIKIFNPLLEYINKPTPPQNNRNEEISLSSAPIETSITGPGPVSPEPALPTLENTKQIVEMPNYSNYDSGKDPYREPIE